MNPQAYNLLCHLRSARDRVTAKREWSMKYFLLDRYERLSDGWPHKTFSVEQCSDSFFEETLCYLLGNKEIPKKEQHNIYQNNYIDWLIEWKKQLDA